MMLTADQLRGRVRIQIDGEEKVLRFDQNAIVNILEKLGLDGLAMLPLALKTFDADILRTLVWAGRLHEDPELSLETVGGWFYAFLPTYSKAIEGINLAIWGSPDGDPEEDDDDADPTEATTKAEEIGTSESRSDSPSED